MANGSHKRKRNRARKTKKNTTNEIKNSQDEDSKTKHHKEIVDQEEEKDKNKERKVLEEETISPLLLLLQTQETNTAQEVIIKIDELTRLLEENGTETGKETSEDEKDDVQSRTEDEENEGKRRSETDGMSEESQSEHEDNEEQEEDSSCSEQDQDRNYFRTYYHTPSTTKMNLRYELAQYMNKLKSAMQELERRYEMQAIVLERLEKIELQLEEAEQKEQTRYQERTQVNKEIKKRMQKIGQQAQENSEQLEQKSKEMTTRIEEIEQNQKKTEETQKRMQKKGQQAQENSEQLQQMNKEMLTRIEEIEKKQKKSEQKIEENIKKTVHTMLETAELKDRMKKLEKQQLEQCQQTKMKEMEEKIQKLAKRQDENIKSNNCSLQDEIEMINLKIGAMEEVQEIQKKKEYDQTRKKQEVNTKKNLEARQADSQTGLMIVGLKQLREGLNMEDRDPNRIIQLLLEKIDMETFRTRTYSIYGRKENRSDANSVVIHFFSQYNKKEAAKRIIRKINQEGIRGVLIRDVFAVDYKDKVKEMVDVGKEIKKKKQVDKWKIINRDGKPVLQAAKQNGRFQNQNLEEWKNTLKMAQ